MISVIIPCNKDRGFLERAYQSVMNQTYRNFEVIVEMADKTLSENVNNAAKKASGDYIKILSEDDTLPPNSLMDLRKSINNLDWVLGWGRNHYEKEFFYNGLFTKLIEVKPIEPIVFTDVYEKNFLHGGAMMYNRQLFIALGGFDESLHNAEEYDFHLQLLFGSGWQPALCPSFVYDHYVSDIQKSRIQRGSDQREKELKYIKDKYV